MGEIFVNTFRIYEISLKKVQMGIGTRFPGQLYIFSFSCVFFFCVCFCLAYLTESFSFSDGFLFRLHKLHVGDKGICAVKTGDITSSLRRVSKRALQL